MQLDRTNNPSWIQTDLERGKWIPYNRYFMDHPEMLMGLSLIHISTPWRSWVKRYWQWTSTPKPT